MTLEEIDIIDDKNGLILDMSKQIESNPLLRIADAIEEILRLVKKDQEDSAARQRQWDNEKK